MGEGGVHESDRILVEKVRLPVCILCPVLGSFLSPSRPVSPQRCWDVALGPLKQIPMNLFIMYMAGNTISIFPAMMVGMMGWRPLQALLSLSSSESSELRACPTAFPVQPSTIQCPRSPSPCNPVQPSAVPVQPSMSHFPPTLSHCPYCPHIPPIAPHCPHTPPLPP